MADKYLSEIDFLIKYSQAISKEEKKRIKEEYKLQIKSSLDSKAGPVLD